MVNEIEKIYSKLFIAKPAFSIFFFSFIVLMLCQYSEGMLDYTARFPVFVENALHYGLTYFPIINGHPFPDYPIGNTFLIYLASLPFGKISIFTIGVPYCLAASLTLVLIYKLGALYDKKWGLYAVLFALFTWKFIDAVHSLAMDVYPMLITTFCFYLVYAARIKQDNRQLWLLPLGLLSGLIMRGSIGFIIPAAVVVSFYLFNKEWRLLIVFSSVSFALFVVGVSLLLLAAYVQGGVNFVHDVMMAESIGRLYGSSSIIHRIYFYFSNGLLNYSFAVLFALAVIFKKRKEIFRPVSQNMKFLLSLSVWFLVIIVMLTLVHDKKARYILSIIPAISLLAAYIFVDSSKLFQTARSNLLRLCFYMPIIGFLGTVILLIYNHFAATPLPAYFISAIISLSLLFIAVVLVKRFYKCHSQYSVMIFICGVLSFMMINLLLYDPIWFHLGHLSQDVNPVFLSYWPW
jgi:4-amino-4-deoxy-L-arabinose transferase-like glycosyltransferase